MSEARDPRVSAVVFGALSEGDTSSVGLPLRMANRHGLIAGATGTGKTVTIQTLAEEFSRAAVPVFLADVKGDLSGLSAPRSAKSAPAPPVRFWDITGARGENLTLGLCDLGPMLLSNLLELTPTQEDGLNIAFRVAREQGVQIVSIDDLRFQLTEIERDGDSIHARFGRVPTASISAIRRRLLALEEEGAAAHFSHPCFDIGRLIAAERSDMAPVNILVADHLLSHPRTYALTLMWLLTELAWQLPETGDPAKPKLVFFFDEAHLLFRNKPKAFLDKIEQTIRLIRSKGVGIFFATQHPADIPPRVMAQLSNKIIHGLRSSTVADRKMIAALAETPRNSRDNDVVETITKLKIGEALVSCLQPDGRPGEARHTRINLPSTHLGPTPERRAIDRVYRQARRNQTNSRLAPGGSIPKNGRLQRPKALRSSVLKARPRRRTIAFQLGWYFGLAAATAAGVAVRYLQFWIARSTKKEWLATQAAGPAPCLQNLAPNRKEPR